MEVVGSVAAVWRYPVKSLQGESLEQAWLGPDGIPGDRGWALADETSGAVLSAKRTAALLRVRAVSRPGGPVVVLPDGLALYAEDADEALGAWLGRRVKVVRAPADERPVIEADGDRSFAGRAGSFADSAPVHVLTTATLEHLRALDPSASFDARRFRPNILVATDAGLTGDVERSWIGRRVVIGDAHIDVTKACGRCVMTTAPQADLPLDRAVLRTVATRTGNEAGVYATVREPGSVRVGDPVRLAPRA